MQEVQGGEEDVLEPPRAKLRYTSPYDDWMAALVASEAADVLLATPGALGAAAAAAAASETPAPQPASPGVHAGTTPVGPAPHPAAGASVGAAGGGAVADADAAIVVLGVSDATAGATATATAAPASAPGSPPAAAPAPAVPSPALALAPAAPAPAAPAPAAPAPAVSAPAPAPAPKGPTTWGPTFGLPTRPAAPTFGWAPRVGSTTASSLGTPLNSWFLTNGMPNFDRSKAAPGAVLGTAAAGRHSMPPGPWSASGLGPSLGPNSLWTPPPPPAATAAPSAPGLTLAPPAASTATATATATAAATAASLAGGGEGLPQPVPVAAPSRTLVALDVGASRVGPPPPSTGPPDLAGALLKPPAWTKWFSPESDVELEARWRRQWDAIRAQDNQLRAQQVAEEAAAAAAAAAGPAGAPPAFTSPRDLLAQVAATLRSERQRAAEFESKLLADLRACLERPAGAGAGARK